MKYAKIIGTGSYLPDRIISNADLETTLDTTDRWIIERTGIHQRHIASTKETASYMATKAAEKALGMAGLSTVDMILVATTTPDAFFPSTACLVQAALGLAPCPAFDLSAACSGFSYGLTIAEQFIRTGQCRHVLLIGSELMSTLVDWSDRTTCVLFGDGAGAVVIGASGTQGIIDSYIQADGSHHHLLYANNKHLPDPYTLKMKGPAVFKQAVIKMGEALSRLLAAQTMHIDDLDWFIPHQANINIIHALASRLKLTNKKIISTIASCGNTSSASIPIALDQAIRDGRVQQGQSLLLGSFGGGITWGATLVRY